METDMGIILRHYPLGEAGLIVVFCTANHGIIRTAARSAQRPKSAFFGQLDLFCSCEIAWNPSQKSDLHPLQSARLISPRLKLRESWQNLSLAGYFTQLLLCVTEKDTPIPGFYGLLDRALDYLCLNPPTQKTLHQFEYRMAQLHGLPHAQALAQLFHPLPNSRIRLLHELSQ